MPESDFERPGTTPHPLPTEWPYHAPSPAPSLVEPATPHVEHVDSGAEPSLGSPRTSPARLVSIAIAAAIIGALIGSAVTALLLRPQEAPAPIDITLESFPREFMGAERNDVGLRDVGFGPTVARLDAEFEDQVAAFRFAYGGDGATLGYGLRNDLTIADGVIPPKVPREGSVDLAGTVRETRRLISLRSASTSCTFEPNPALNPETGIEELGDFSAKGLTECVLVDPERNLSLRIAQDPQFRGTDPFETAAAFSDAIKDLHHSLIQEG